jgi:hypothetical protein
MPGHRDRHLEEGAGGEMGKANGPKASIREFFRLIASTEPSISALVLALALGAGTAEAAAIPELPIRARPLCPAARRQVVHY